jgi:hypothetical protein
MPARHERGDTRRRYGYAILFGFDFFRNADDHLFKATRRPVESQRGEEERVFVFVS